MMISKHNTYECIMIFHNLYQTFLDLYYLERKCIFKSLNWAQIYFWSCLGSQLCILYFNILFILYDGYFRHNKSSYR